jgi:hypothetical protein
MTTTLCRLLVLGTFVTACSSEPGTPTNNLFAAAPPAPAGEATTEASPAAQRLATFYAEKEGKPCAVYPAGQEFEFNKIRYKLEAPLVADPEVRLPWIRNGDERAALGRKGTKALILPASIQNTTPIALPWPGGVALITRDGERANEWYYNSQLYLKQSKRVEWPQTLKPDTWYDTISLYGVRADLTEGALLYFFTERYWRDARGYRHREIVAHAVVDLAPPKAIAPIRGG